MTYLTYLNYVTGSSATISACCVTPCIVPNPEEHAKKVQKKDQQKLKSLGIVLYFRGAAITELYESSHSLHFHTYISSAGSFQPERVQYLPQSLTVNGRSGFFFPSSTTHPDLLTSKYCGL